MQCANGTIHLVVLGAVTMKDMPSATRPVVVAGMHLAR